MKTIDLNCDLGEGAGHDEELMPLISSANIACGAHAGDEQEMRAAVALAEFHGVAIGAHPGFDDRENFGRRALALSPMEVSELVVRQFIALSRIAPVRHVKLHGALYTLAAKDRAIADAIARAIAELDPTVTLFGLAGSELVRAGRAHALPVANEVFADRTYQSDGSLTPRLRPDALIDDEDAAVEQVLDMVLHGFVRATDGTKVAIVADTICVHGDGAHAVSFARRLRRELQAAGISIRAM